MTGKGNKATVATVGRELREARKTIGELAGKNKALTTRLEAAEKRLDNLVDQVDESVDALLGDGYADRRHVAGLEDRVTVLEAPWYRRRYERRLATERRLARLRESATLAQETAGRIKAPAVEPGDNETGELKTSTFGDN